MVECGRARRLRRHEQLLPVSLPERPVAVPSQGQGRSLASLDDSVTFRFDTNVLVRRAMMVPALRAGVPGRAAAVCGTRRRAGAATMRADGSSGKSSARPRSSRPRSPTTRCFRIRSTNFSPLGRFADRRLRSVARRSWTARWRKWTMASSDDRSVSGLLGRDRRQPHADSRRFPVAHLTVVFL